jgi:hypothetical protein
MVEPYVYSEELTAEDTEGPQRKSTSLCVLGALRGELS